MPMTAAEKQKKYREKLKNENPDKFEETRRKAKHYAYLHDTMKKKRVLILKRTNKNYVKNGKKIEKRQMMKKLCPKMNPQHHKFRTSNKLMTH